MSWTAGIALCDMIGSSEDADQEIGEVKSEQI
jgi:hypothetical protein